MNKPPTTEEKLREEWDMDFPIADMPKLVRKFEMKNKDGSYSCMTCGIKLDAIADWWIERINLLLSLQATQERERVIEECLEALPKKMTMKAANKSKSDAGFGWTKGHNDFLEQSIHYLSTLKEKK